jgi:hypothetical protein
VFGTPPSPCPLPRASSLSLSSTNELIHGIIHDERESQLFPPGMWSKREINTCANHFVGLRNLMKVG